jgi:hypothetical protein
VILHIRTVDDLESLRRRRRHTRRFDGLLLEVGGALSEADAKAWETQLSRYYFACGCEVASVFLLVALVGYVLVIGVASTGFGSATWRELFGGVLICFVAAITGKVAGLLYARGRLRATIRSLTSRLTATQP